MASDRMYIDPHIIGDVSRQITQIAEQLAESENQLLPEIRSLLYSSAPDGLMAYQIQIHMWEAENTLNQFSWLRNTTTIEMWNGASHMANVADRVLELNGEMARYATNFVSILRNSGLIDQIGNINTLLPYLGKELPYHVNDIIGLGLTLFGDKNLNLKTATNDIYGACLGIFTPGVQEVAGTLAAYSVIAGFEANVYQQAAKLVANDPVSSKLLNSVGSDLKIDSKHMDPDHTLTDLARTLTDAGIAPNPAASISASKNRPMIQLGIGLLGLNMPGMYQFNGTKLGSDLVNVYHDLGNNAVGIRQFIIDNLQIIRQYFQPPPAY